MFFLTIATQNEAKYKIHDFSLKNSIFDKDVIRQILKSFGNELTQPEIDDMLISLKELYGIQKITFKEEKGKTILVLEGPVFSPMRTSEGSYIHSENSMNGADVEKIKQISPQQKEIFVPLSSLKTSGLQFSLGTYRNLEIKIKNPQKGEPKLMEDVTKRIFYFGEEKIKILKMFYPTKGNEDPPEYFMGKNFSISSCNLFSLFMEILGDSTHFVQKVQNPFENLFKIKTFGKQKEIRVINDIRKTACIFYLIESQKIILDKVSVTSESLTSQEKRKIEEELIEFFPKIYSEDCIRKYLDEKNLVLLNSDIITTQAKNNIIYSLEVTTEKKEISEKIITNIYLENSSSNRIYAILANCGVYCGLPYNNRAIKKFEDVMKNSFVVGTSFQNGTLHVSFKGEPPFKNPNQPFMQMNPKAGKLEVKPWTFKKTLSPLFYIMMNPSISAKLPSQKRGGVPGIIIGLISNLTFSGSISLKHLFFSTPSIFGIDLSMNVTVEDIYDLAKWLLTDRNKITPDRLIKLFELSLNLNLDFLLKGFNAAIHITEGTKDEISIENNSQCKQDFKKTNSKKENYIENLFEGLSLNSFSSKNQNLFDKTSILISTPISEQINLSDNYITQKDIFIDLGIGGMFFPLEKEILPFGKISLSYSINTKLTEDWNGSSILFLGIGSGLVNYKGLKQKYSIAKGYFNSYDIRVPLFFFSPVPALLTFIYEIKRSVPGIIDMKIISTEIGWFFAIGILYGNDFKKIVKSEEADNYSSRFKQMDPIFVCTFGPEFILSLMGLKMFFAFGISTADLTYLYSKLQDIKNGKGDWVALILEIIFFNLIQRINFDYGQNTNGINSSTLNFG